MVLGCVANWSLVELPRVNCAILAGELPGPALVQALAGSVLVDLPGPESFSPREAQQLLVHLSFCGASVARHYQEHDLARRLTPERAFDPLPVGAERVPFRTYFARLADQTGTGHCHRDSYASVVRWNLPTAEVHWRGERLAVLPGVFDDSAIHTYTGDRGERLFLELMKKAEALELAVNGLLEPLSAGTVGVHGAEAIWRVRTAATVLTAARQLMSDFGLLPASEGLRSEHFLDVFRQFAGHWQVGDIPPSGALDAEALTRDLLLGLDIPDRDEHVRRLFPGLLGTERAELTRLLGRPPLPVTVLAELGLDAAVLREMPATDLRATVRQHPALAAWYQLLTAHARTAGIHLAVAKKFLFRLARERDLAGLPDMAVVSRRAGTTGMTESLLERLARARHNHVLSGLHHIPHLELLALADVDDPEVVPSTELDTLVRFVGPDVAPTPTPVPVWLAVPADPAVSPARL